MADDIPNAIDDLSKDELVKLAGIYAGGVLVHYGLWFARTVADHGVDAALDAEPRVLSGYGSAALRRLAGRLGIPLEDGAPRVLKELPREELVGLLQDLAKTWLTGDGLWFREIESDLGMTEAKLTNDGCWSIFARLEAAKIRGFLGLSDRAGLCGLEKALRFRLYSSYNDHASHWEDPDTLVWEMIGCRVQETRQRKGLAPYPCRSAGVVEYTNFAKGIDERIHTECLACPPEPQPGGFCAWRFTFA